MNAKKRLQLSILAKFPEVEIKRSVTLIELCYLTHNHRCPFYSQLLQGLNQFDFETLQRNFVLNYSKNKPPTLNLIFRVKLLQKAQNLKQLQTLICHCGTCQKIVECIQFTFDHHTRVNLIQRILFPVRKRIFKFLASNKKRLNITEQIILGEEKIIIKVN